MFTVGSKERPISVGMRGARAGAKTFHLDAVVPVGPARERHVGRLW